MGRKSKAALLGLIERITELAKHGKTCKQIEAELRAEGVDISREAIRRTVKTSAEAAKEFNRCYAEAQAITEAVRNNPGTDVIEAINAVIAGKFMNEVKNIDGMEITSVSDLTKLITSLSNSQTKVGALKMKYVKGYEAAKKDFMAQLSKELKDNYPELLGKLLDIINGLRAPEE